MPRYDKYDPIGGGFRTQVAAAVTLGNAFVAYGVGLDTSGRAVLGAGNTGVIGLMIAHNAKAIGDVVDIMTQGEIVEGSFTAGSVYYANTGTGALETTAPATGANKTRIGFATSTTRLIVQVQVIQGP